MSWLKAAERIAQQVAGGRVGDLPVVWVLGPPGSGKTQTLRSAARMAGETGHAAVYLDLRQAPDQDLDSFYDWILSSLRRQKWPVPARLPSPRLDFVRCLADVSRAHPMGAMLALDHVEAASESAAMALVCDLREYQEGAALDPARRIVCVPSGCASIIDLRRRANSPNMQFAFEVLPAWNGDAAEDCVRHYFAQNGSAKPDDAAVRELAKWTGGEPAFLSMFAARLAAGPVTARDVQSAARSILQQAADLPYLSHIVVRYWIDPELKRCVDLLVNKRPAYLKDTATTFSDLDKLQLRGAVVAQTEQPYSYRLRNLLLQRLIEGLLDAHFGRSDAKADDALVEIGRSLGSCSDAATLDDWKACMDRAWDLLLGETAQNVDIQFSLASAANGSEAWCTALPLAACWLRQNAGKVSIIAEVQVRNGWFVRAEVRPGPGFRATVQTRHEVECWISFFARGAGRAALLHLAEKGSAILREEAAVSDSRANRVFVVFGRDTDRRDEMYKFLAKSGLEPIDWIKAKQLTGNAAPSIFEVVDTAMKHAQACIVLLTGDDEGRLLKPFRKQTDETYELRLTPQPRPNVIFEAGMALGSYRRRTILIKFGATRPFSDLGGFTMIEYNEGRGFRRELLSALRTAGCNLHPPAHRR